MGAVHRPFDRVEELGGGAERIRVDAVVDPPAFAAAVEQAGAVQHGQVLGDLWLGCADGVLEVAGAQGSAGGDVRDEVQAEGMGQGAQDLEGHVARLGDHAGLSDRQRGRLG